MCKYPALPPGLSSPHPKGGYIVRKGEGKEMIKLSTLRPFCNEIHLYNASFSRYRYVFLLPSGAPRVSRDIFKNSCLPLIGNEEKFQGKMKCIPYIKLPVLRMYLFSRCKNFSHSIWLGRTYMIDGVPREISTVTDRYVFYFMNMFVAI